MKVFIVEDFKRDMYAFCVIGKRGIEACLRSSEWLKIKHRYNLKEEECSIAIRDLNDKVIQVFKITPEIFERVENSKGVYFLMLIKAKDFSSLKPKKKVYRKKGNN